MDINYATLVDPVLRAARGRVPDFAGMQAGDKVLDMCCGSGAQLYAYAQKGLLVQGVDNDPRMLDLARRYYVDSSLAADTLVLADAAYLPFADGSFDFTSVSLALHDKDAALVGAILSEMKRVTRAGGGMVMMDYSAPLPCNLLGGFMQLVELMVGGEHSRNFRSYQKYAGLPHIMQANGLRAVRSERVKSGTLTLVLARMV